MVTIEIVINSTHVMGICVTISCRYCIALEVMLLASSYPRRSRSAIGVDIVFTLDVCLYVCMYVSALERKRLIGMT